MGEGGAVNGKLELIRELKKRGLYVMETKARAGEYSRLASPSPSPIVELVRQLGAADHPDLSARARNGDFDHER